MYVQDKIEYSDEIRSLLDGGAHTYFCGLKGMMLGIQGTLWQSREGRAGTRSCRSSRRTSSGTWRFTRLRHPHKLFSLWCESNAKKRTKINC
jgi:hypothetical protein